MIVLRGSEIRVRRAPARARSVARPAHSGSVARFARSSPIVFAGSLRVICRFNSPARPLRALCSLRRSGLVVPPRPPPPSLRSALVGQRQLQGLRNTQFFRARSGFCMLNFSRTYATKIFFNVREKNFAKILRKSFSRSREKISQIFSDEKNFASRCYPDVITHKFIYFFILIMLISHCALIERTGDINFLRIKFYGFSQIWRRSFRNARLNRW